MTKRLTVGLAFGRSFFENAFGKVRRPWPWQFSASAELVHDTQARDTQDVPHENRAQNLGKCGVG